MEEEMEDKYEYTFTAIEVDFDYEFDSPTYFDFCRQETLLEAREAERWFDSAGTYPPSPFAARLVPRLDLLLGSHVNTSPKSKNGDEMDLSESDSDEVVEEGVPAMDATINDNDDRDKKPCLNILDKSMETFHNQMQKIQSGLSFCNDMIKDNFKAKTKLSVKPSFPRSSTLMKPTASQLAKQNKTQHMGRSRFLKSLTDKNQKNCGNHSVMEVQAPKRQKLEGGHLRKVGDTTQPSNFVHKDPKKDGTGIGKSMHTKMRITVPREPDLETAHRAQRLRPKAGKETNDFTTPGSTFKAHPLNRKILESPSLLLPKRSTPQVPQFREFHFKTSERALHHSSATSSTIPNSNSTKVYKFSSTLTAESGNRDPRSSSRQNPVDHPSQETSHTFKALPLNKKIFTSKGDIGVFRNNKRETTVPLEFNFHTGKRAHNNLPIELFNNLSLASDPHASSGSQLKTLCPNFLLSKGSKENRCDNLRHES
ncbi:hypothetical protein Leryth_003255 [Lithospermum erythrorhizon]|nr:hypothetical protein Leryth_003255 [Lithospermum erythrorhizon]